MRIIKLLLLVGIGAALLPTPPETEGATLSPLAALQESRAMISAAGDVISDANGFCQRQPDACVTATKMVDDIGIKARYAIRLINEWAGVDGAAQIRISPTAASGEIGTNTIAAKTGRIDHGLESQSQNTLTIDDILPPWRGHTSSQQG